MNVRLNRFAAAWLLNEVARRHRERKLLVMLSRLSPHLVRDMGFDPAQVAEALEGSWHEHPQRRLPRV